MLESSKFNTTTTTTFEPLKHQIRTLRLKIEINNVEESIQKRLLRTMKESMGLLGPDAAAVDALNELGEEFVTELKLVYKVDLTSWLRPKEPQQLQQVPTEMDGDLRDDEELVDTVDLPGETRRDEDFYARDDDLDNNDDDDDDDDEANFFDTHEDADSLKREEENLKEMKMRELKAVKQKILDIGSKKSAIRLSLVTFNKSNSTETFKI